MNAHRKLLQILSLSLVLAVVLIAHPARAASPTTAPIGVAKVDITPETPVCMYGYASRKTESEGVAGRLCASALAIGGNDAPGPAVLLTVDCGAVPRDLRDQVYERIAQKPPVAAERFVLCNSHCHSGPNLKGMDSLEGQEREHLELYAKLLADRLVQVVEQALDNRQPASLAIARGSVGIAANRRVLTDGKWTGFGAVADAPTDHEVVVLKVVGDDGNCRALVTNYACHNTTLRGDYKQIHGDWAGSAQRFLETDHPGTTALITIGCGADSDPCPHGTAELCDQHGRALADEVNRLLTGPWIPISPSIAARQAVLEIPWQQQPDLESVRENANNSWAIQSLIERLDKGEELPDPRTFQINTWTFADDLAMVFLTDELVVDYVLRLKQEFDPGRLWVTAYTNNVSSYIASPRIIAEGGYEARNSLSSLVTFGQPERLEPPMLERVVAAVRQLLPETFRAR